MNDQAPANLILSRLRWVALVVGIAFSGLSVFGLLSDRSQFFQSYLIAYVLWLSVSLGATGLLMLNYVAGGRWGVVIRRLAEAAGILVVLMAVLFIPLLLGLPYLYKWARPGVLEGEPELSNVVIFHQMPLFYGRLAIYFIVWLGISFLLKRWSVQFDRSGDLGLSRKVGALSAPGLFLYVFTITFASVDLLCSLEPGWDSTIIGLMVSVDCLLASLAFIVIIAVLLAKVSPLREALTTDRLHDYGNLLLTFVMLWAYVSFSQYLVIWMGNLPEESHWYYHRTVLGWEWIAFILTCLHFALPFFLLLFRYVKRGPMSLVCVALGILVMRVVDLLWMVAPAFRPELKIHWLDFVVPVAMGGIFVAVFTWVLQRQPLLPREHPDPVHAATPIVEAA
jgi:hypothetical protein